MQEHYNHLVREARRGLHHVFLAVIRDIPEDARRQILGSHEVTLREVQNVLDRVEGRIKDTEPSKFKWQEFVTRLNTLSCFSGCVHQDLTTEGNKGPCQS